MLPSGEWLNFGSNECTEISLVWKQLIFISSCFKAYGVQRFHLQEVCVRGWFCILPRMKKSMALFHIKNFSCHVTLATFKKENFNMWVTSGSHPNCSVGQWIKWVNRCDPRTFIPAVNTNLEVVLQSNLWWSKCIETITVKANSTLGMVRRNIKKASISVKEQIYKTLIRPQLEYVSCTWSPWLKQDILELEKVQRLLLVLYTTTIGPQLV